MKTEIKDKIQQKLENISEMLNSRIYNLMVEFADMRGEIKDLRMLLYKDMEGK